MRRALALVEDAARVKLACLVDTDRDGATIQAGPCLVAIFHATGIQNHARIAVTQPRRTFRRAMQFGQVRKSGFEGQKMCVQFRRAGQRVDCRKAQPFGRIERTRPDAAQGDDMGMTA